ncbi:MAG: AAA family ATPase [Proteobacteria bacterium]|nr:AAA family ATPase [Pseudomonadota bacterium]
MTDKALMPPFLIGGLKNSGKTALGCAIIQIAAKAGKQWGAMKPFDIGLLERNALEQENDATYYCQVMAGSPTESLVSPYIAHENYPIELSYARDGIRIDWDFVNERIDILQHRYHQTIIELPPGLSCPLSDKLTALEWAMSVSNQIIWVMEPQSDRFEHNLIELEALFVKKANVIIVLNNRNKVTDMDLIFFLWEKVEKLFSHDVEGMIPYIRNCKTGSEVLMEAIDKNLAGLFGKIQ